MTPPLMSVAELSLRLHRARRVLLFTGAGISAAADIPTFEQIEAGKSGFSRRRTFAADVWRDEDETKRLLSILVDMRLQIETANRTAFHDLVEALISQKKLRRHYTQNIDGLHSTFAAGDVDDAGKSWTIELHGNIRRVSCMTCAHNTDWTLEMFTDGRFAPCPRCEEEKGIPGRRSARSKLQGLRPQIVLYDEEYADEAAATLDEDYEYDWDMLLVIGTSLATPGARKIVKEFAKLGRGRKDQSIYCINPCRPPTACDKIWTGVLVDTIANFVSGYLELSSGTLSQTPGNLSPMFDHDVGGMVFQVQKLDDLTHRELALKSAHYHGLSELQTSFLLDIASICGY